MKSNVESSENRLLGGISTQTIRNLLPRSVSNNYQKMNSIRQKSKSSKENTPPDDPNVQTDKNMVSTFVSEKSPTKTVNLQKEGTRSVHQQDRLSLPSDPPVKVVVRIRPANWREKGEDRTVRKISSDSLSVGDRRFTFDSVVDSSSTQEDIFQLVGVPLVKHSLAGFNTSIFSYGQTGSGKTYTMWGPPSAMVEGHSPSSNQGIVPRIFQMLFSEIQREQENSEEKQINYQCRCSFLEIYNEQIGDLLDPIQRNLEIRDDPRNGIYVENLTEEYVTSYDDVTQILIKGLSNRKVGATSINSKSSRSHIIFTCIIESWCKGTTSKCFSSSKTSRISLVDLAGSERSKLADAGRLCIKEGRNVKRSLSHLGHLVHILAGGAHSGRPQNVPYRSSCLTHLLQESLGGNAKLTVICAISPDDRCKGETLSTLRFGQKANSIQNEPVINEITEDDVNDLSDQIRQLKEELIRAKSTGYNSVGNNSGCFKGRNARESLNQLRLSLNRSLILPCVDSDSEEDINVDEKNVKELCIQLNNLQSSCEENLSGPSDDKECLQFSSFEESSDTEITNEHICSMNTCPEDSVIKETHLNSKPKKELHCKEYGSVACQDNSSTSEPAFIKSSLSILPCQQSSVLQDPTLSESPKIENIQKKSISTLSNLSVSQNHVSESSRFNLEVPRQSVKRSDHIRASLRSSKIFSGPTESLAASLHRGLQIIDYHQRNSASNKSSVAFSFEHLALKPCQTIDKADASVQTLAGETEYLAGPATSFICASCKQAGVNGSDQVQDSLNMWIVPVDEAGTSRGLKNRVQKDGEKVLAEALQREKELKNMCAEQEAKIEKLNRLVEQYKHERKNNPDIEHILETRTLHIDALTNGAVSTEDLKNEKHSSLEEENKLQGCNCRSHPEILKAKSDLRELQEEIDFECKNTHFDMSEREELLKEIEILRKKLQSYIDVSSNESRFSQLRKSCVDFNSLDKSGEELEKERQRWTEIESEWISLTDELRIDLESNRRHAEKVETELRLEKKVTEELDDALNRAVLGHGRFVEHYADLQEKYDELLGRHKKIMQGILEVKRAAAKAGSKGNGSRFIKSLAAELSDLRIQREREREHLKKENKSLRIQLRDTTEAVHAAGELLVRLREAEEAVSVAEENYMKAQKETEKVRKQMEKQKRKHAMEMVTMKQYLAESRLPESALQPLYWQEEDRADSSTPPDNDQAWRAEFGPIYQERF